MEAVRRTDAEYALSKLTQILKKSSGDASTEVLKALSAIEDRSYYVQDTHPRSDCFVSVERGLSYAGIRQLARQELIRRGLDA